MPDKRDALRPTPNGDNRRVYRERNRRSVKFRHRILRAVNHDIGMRRSTDRQVLSATRSSPCLPSRGQTLKLRALLRPAVFTAAASRAATHIKRGRPTDLVSHKVLSRALHKLWKHEIQRTNLCRRHISVGGGLRVPLAGNWRSLECLGQMEKE